jgi:N-acetylneuraminic acid mutarotase
MSFNVYPDAATAALLGKPLGAPIRLDSTEAMSKFVPLANHVGPDPTLGNAPATFIRVAMQGDPAERDMQLKFELLAHDPERPAGSPALTLNPNTAINLGSAVALFDDVNNTAAALAYFVPPFSGNVYLLKVVIQIAGTRLWLRMTNTTGTEPEDDEPRRLVWVVADSERESRQPWIQVTSRFGNPAEIKFDTFVGQMGATALPLQITNFGTGPLTVVGVTPALPAPFTVLDLPVTIGPNARALVRFMFDAPSSPGENAPAVFRLVTADPPDQGPFALGHNDQFILNSRTFSNVWVVRSPMPTGRLGLALSGAKNGRIYAAGGWGVTESDRVFSHHTFEEYDPATDSWATRAPMPTSRYRLGLAGASNGKVYAVGGTGQDAGGSWIPALSTLEEYDLTTGRWTTKAPMPTAREGFGFAAAGNGKLYAVGGTDSRGVLPTVEEYDPATNTWKTKAPMPTKRTKLVLVAAANGKLYALGGASIVARHATVEEYDPGTNVWTTKAPMLTAREEFGGAAARNGKVYAIGGWDGTGTMAVVEEYDPATNKWATRAPMLAARDQLGVAAATNGKIYAVGGSSAFGGHHSTIENPGRNITEECSP